MNKLIKELAEEAGITTNLDTDYFEKDMNKWVDYYSEKFAQLIVADVLNEVLQAMDEGMDVYYTVEEIFRVEE